MKTLISDITGINQTGNDLFAGTDGQEHLIRKECK